MAKRKRSKLAKVNSVRSFDLETTGLEAYRGDTIFAYCIGDEDGNVDVQRLDWTEPRRSCAARKLQDFLNDTSVAKVCHNVKFEIGMLKANGWKIPEETVWHDTMIMSGLLRNLSRSHALDSIAWELSGWSRELDLRVAREGRAYRGYQNIPEETMTEYQVADGQRTILLFKTFWPDIESDPGLLADYWNEIELIKVTQRMEEYGIQLDVEGTRKVIEESERVVLEVEEELEELIGEQYNLSSGPQVAELLYEHLKLPILAFTDSGKPSTTKDVLNELRIKHPHPVLDLIQRHRSFVKGGAIAEGYLELTDSKGIVHPNVKTNFAQTGREACDTPNLQNVPKETNAKNPFIVPLRRCFKPRDGCVLFSLDQSGIELRLIIEAAGSTRMMKLMREGVHPHIYACEIFYGKLWRGKKEQPELYSAGKNGHFCLCYGGSLGKFASALSLEVSAARPGYERYRREFPEIAFLATNGAKVVEETGYVTTPFGRNLYIPHGKSYAWLNYYIQGTAAGIIKRGQVEVAKWLRRVFPEVHQVLTVHDDIMYECSVRLWEKRGEQILAGIAKRMVTIPQVKVPLEVEASYTYHSWDKMKEVALCRT